MDVGADFGGGAVRLRFVRTRLLFVSRFASGIGGGGSGCSTATGFVTASGVTSVGGGGASTSRLPFDCTIETTPEASISSIMRAARL